ncbi:FIT family protein scs3 [Paramyrothecium foliicola]|nr:FIT family protein scs3 [Paramyrothecium foliicola]
MVTTRRGLKTNPSEDMTPASRATSTTATRTPPFLPTPLERAALAVFPVVLVFGTVFSVLSPELRASPYDPITQSHAQDPSLAPNYFARKSNVFNVFFVKRGWGWTTFAAAFFLLSHPSVGPAGLVPTPRKLRAGLRWVLVTAWWFVVTQWFFGAPIIDRGFRWTGGRCELARREVVIGDDPSVGDFVTAVACKAAGGRWKGGHDISGHVFLLVLGTGFLLQEVGWPLLRWSGWSREERCVVMTDGAVKSAGVEAETATGEGEGKPAFGIGGQVATAIAGLNVWMLLMTAIYFHTWFEKFTGLLTALVALYAVYYVPRFVPALRQVVGMPAGFIMAARLKAPANLPELVRKAFAKARSESELHYFPTQVTILPVNSIPFQLRFSPSLANKPKGPPPDPSKPHKPFDPFAQPPPGLFVADLGPAHFLVLNKFAVVPEHFILATRDFKHQTHVLERDDLEATLACIRAYEGDGSQGLFAFFNCGDHSGASQPHRHIQLLPVATMKDGLPSDTPWEVLANHLTTGGAPFVTFAEPINLDMSAGQLHAAYLRLYRQACRAVAAYAAKGSDATATAAAYEAPATGETKISYNLAMTKSSLVVCPRLAEGAKILGPEGAVLGSMALNGTLLAGTALVKNELEWEVLKKDSTGLLGVLKGIGIPSDEFDESAIE